MHRKTRFVCVSDTHAYAPSEAGFKLPPGDVLIHAGDLTNRGSLAELQKTVDWISRADYEVKIVVCGLFFSFFFFFFDMASIISIPISIQLQEKARLYK